MKKWLCILLLISLSLASGSLGAQSSDPSNNMTYLYGFPSDTYKKQLDQIEGQVGTVAPNYFNLTPEGELITTVDQNFVDYAHQKGFRVTPFISNHWDQKVGAKAMENGQKLAKDLAKAAIDYNLDGVNIDIENLTYAQRDLQTAFLKTLSEQLKPHNKTVSIAVAPARYDTTKGWVGSYDFEAIGKIVDVVFIMAYDQSYPMGPEGPVASLPWVEESVKYFIKKVPKEKLVLGVPFYGRYWTESDKGKGIYYPAAMKLINRNQAKIEYDPVNATNVAKFKDQQTGKQYEIWFDSADTILERIALVEKYGLRGWGAWHMGQEDTRLWSLLNEGAKANPLVFKDIRNHWAKDSILHMAEQKWIRGYNDASFRPDNKITREEVATLLTSALNFETKTGVAYQDISTSRWSFPYVSTISVYGMMKGYPDQTFRPTSNITRAELATALARSFALTDDGNADSEPFQDVQSHWAKADIEKLQQAGIITGYENGAFRPNQTVTRAEVASMLSRIAR